MAFVPARIPVPEYNEIDAVNYSTLKYVLKSPRHYYHAKTIGTEQTPAMALGTACHCAILEPERFSDEFAVWDSQTKSGRSAPRTGKAWEHFRRVNAGATILTTKQYETAAAMRDAVRADPIAMQFLSEGDAEVALVWTDEATKLLCKGRVDWITRIDGEPVIVGLKTAADAGFDAFSRQSNRLLYHLQWAMYREGYHTITGEIPRVIEIAVESKVPHDSVVYEIGSDVIEPGLALYREALDEVARCRDKGVWPGQGGGEIVSLVLPAWAAGVPSDDEVALDMTGLDMSAIEGLES